MILRTSDPEYPRRQDAQETLFQRLNDLAALEQRADQDTIGRSQSSSVTMTSCAISTNQRVRYPEFAVFSAVSAKPFARRASK